MRFRLADGDRERLGLPEWIDFDIDSFDVIEAEEIEDAGYEAGLFLEQLAGRERATADGGKTVHIPARALRTATWLAAKRAGCAVPYAQFRFDLLGARMEASTEQGKDPAPDPASEKSADATS